MSIKNKPMKFYKVIVGHNIYKQKISLFQDLTDAQIWASSFQGKLFEESQHIEIVYIQPEEIKFLKEVELNESRN